MLLHISLFLVNNKYMIYFICFLVGVLNAVFASGSGQILVLYLITFLKIETHKARVTSVAVLSISSILALTGYKNIAHFEIYKIVLLIIISVFTGSIGTKLMKKIPAQILNLLSVVLLVGLTLFKLLKRG